jgi:cytochrome c-type biogenesis protein CcmH/NrfG
MDPFDKGTQQLRDTLKECFEQMRFARAAELARSRRYLEAEGLLAPNGRESPDPRDLDLLARISAQQRQYERSRRLWEKALQQSPGNADYERAIECTKEAERFQAKIRKGVVIAFSFLAVITVTICIWSFFHRPSPSSAIDEQKQANSSSSTPQPAPATPTNLRSQPSN